jgi:protein-tyrosine phosphatase
VPIKSILYVCTGNVFRSPVAEQMTKKLLEDSNIKVESAGILEYKGPRLRDEVLELARRYGFDLSAHKPRQVNAVLVDGADLILVFENGQVGELVEHFPNAKRKTHTIKNYAGFFDGKDMEDLWDKPVEAFERFIKETSVYVKRCVDRIRSHQNRKLGVYASKLRNEEV